MTLSKIPVAPPVPIYSGDTVLFPAYQFCDAAGEPVDMSSWSWRAQWRKTPKSAIAVELTIDDTEADNGIIRISATPTDTTNMGGSGFWDLQGTRDGFVQTWMTGTTVYSTGVTRG